MQMWLYEDEKIFTRLEFMTHLISNEMQKYMMELHRVLIAYTIKAACIFTYILCK
jgi:hypothetical protein